MNLVILYLISQTISTSSSTDSFFDFLGEPSMESTSVSLGSQKQERGYMKNCYPNSNYSLSWEPKDIDPHGSLTFFIKYKNPAQFDSGEYTVDIKYRFIHVSKTTKITCQKDLRKIIPSQNCPVEKERFLYHYNVVYRNIIHFKNFKGTFRVKLTMQNDNGESLLCGTLEANLL
ncbi:hypothetical protein CHS0354_020674 [Potamilus streckersoni]|uniref:MD-2-related lipid-recognition domain-containing protein n=1 Tax=Potamilus streckersoni TaxID=2493646 RepID=A0AAE0SQL4_9BIVA|nr:hypothetical protein CHS0354_020674 [Potamilus streckersoni]